MILEGSVYKFNQFSQYKQLVHGFSTSDFGSLKVKDPEWIKRQVMFAQQLSIDPEKIMRMLQVHSSTIAWVDQHDVGATIENTDGLITKEKNIFLAVSTADCVPILLFDRYKKVVGAIHAGWRGLYSEIIPKAIAEMVMEGSNPADILAGIGPCIRSCCYSIDTKRKELFEEKFKNNVDEPVSYFVACEGKLYLNLPLLARLQLQEAGVLEENIEDSEICTKENESFYSYRRQGEESGRFLGLIGLI